MAVGKDKDRIFVTVDKEVKQILEKLSEEDDRTLSTYCGRILRDYVNNLKK